MDENIIKKAIELKNIREQKKVLDNQDKEYTNEIVKAMQEAHVEEYTGAISFKLCVRDREEIDSEVLKQLNKTDIEQLVDCGAIAVNAAKFEQFLRERDIKVDMRKFKKHCKYTSLIFV